MSTMSNSRECGCHEEKCQHSNPIPVRLSDITGPLALLTERLTAVLGYAHTLAAPALYHVIGTEVVVAPAEPIYVIGDVIEGRRFGPACQYRNRRTGQTVGSSPLSPTMAAQFTPLEGEFGMTVKTVTVAAGAIYEVNCPDQGFTSLTIESSSAMNFASTAADLASVSTRRAQPAGVAIERTKFPTEPRIAPFFIQPSANATVQIAYTS